MTPPIDDAPDVDVTVDPPKRRRKAPRPRVLIAALLIGAVVVLGASGALPADAIVQLLGLAASATDEHAPVAPSAGGAPGVTP